MLPFSEKELHAAAKKSKQKLFRIVSKKKYLQQSNDNDREIRGKATFIFLLQECQNWAFSPQEGRALDPEPLRSLPSRV